MELTLTEAETILWNTSADWKAGYLAALEETVSPEVQVVTIEAHDGTRLAGYARHWTPVP
jgi:hypothetical protein